MRSGVERRSDVYCRCSCDLRSSGARWDGGWLCEWRTIGGAKGGWWRVGAGVIKEAVAVDAYLERPRGGRVLTG